MRTAPGRGFLGCSAPGRTAPGDRLAHHLRGAHRESMAAAASSAIFFPDVSGYQAGLTIQPGTVAVLAKATEGSTFTDGSYAGFRAQAAARGAVFGAYHFLWGGSVAEAQHCHSVVGSTPLMLDVENTSQPLHLADVIAFVKNYRALGGVVHLAYIPRWYWAGTMGSPSLLPLQQLGVQLVASNYTSYSDSGAGWAPYGGVTPVQWQYTDSYPYGGMAVDFNAFRGSVAGYRALLTGSAPTPAPDSKDDLEMAKIRFVRRAGTAAVYRTNHVQRTRVLDQGDLDDQQWWLTHHEGYAAADVAVQDVDNLDAFGPVVGPDPS